MLIDPMSAPYNGGVMKNRWLEKKSIKDQLEQKINQYMKTTDLTEAMKEVMMSDYDFVVPIIPVKKLKGKFREADKICRNWWAKEIKEAKSC